MSLRTRSSSPAKGPPPEDTEDTRVDAGDADDALDGAIEEAEPTEAAGQGLDIDERVDGGEADAPEGAT